MALPNPIPDNPLKWDGWRQFSSANPYERLGLDFESNPSAAQIEENCRQLLVWWQKKLPLKNQPSNPMAQLLRIGLDEAPGKLTEARTQLLDPKQREQIDADLLRKVRETAFAEFNKFLSFALSNGGLNSEEEESLYVMGGNLGLKRPEMEAVIEETLQRTGLKRIPREPTPVVLAPATPAPSAPAAPTEGGGPREEFLRMLRLSGMDEITDDQRDAFCNMGEALGLSGGDAEDIIDEYLEERVVATAAALAKQTQSARPAGPAATAAAKKKTGFIVSPLQRVEEREKYPPFTNTVGIEMRLVPSGSFQMGSTLPGAVANEAPVTKTNLTAFYLARWPVTNAQYEAFDPAHRARRAPWADDHHPVVYVSAIEAARFCEWLTQRERRHYRLPTEAEWEYAARGPNGRVFPWGDTLQTGNLANFADANTTFPWAEKRINDGYAETAPVGRYPASASPFGIEEMAGNVWEWCLDGMTAYPGRERTNPRGPLDGPRRIYRGGSWKSRIGSLRASARSFNVPTYMANDVGFRIACEV